MAGTDNPGNKGFAAGAAKAPEAAETIGLFNEISKLTDADKIDNYVLQLFNKDGPRALQTIESYLKPSEKLIQTGTKSPIQEGTEGVWDAALKRWWIGENNEIGNAISNLKTESDITKFLEKLAQRGVFHQYFNDINGSVSRGYARPGTEATWRKILDEIA